MVDKTRAISISAGCRLKIFCVVLCCVCSEQHQKLELENTGSGLIVCMHYSSIVVSKHT